MKQSKHLLATIVMLLCSLAANAYDFEVDGIYYNITDKYTQKVEVTYKSVTRSYSGSVEIPNSVVYGGDTYDVIAIGYMAFQQCTDLTSIVIPESATSIAALAFNQCNKLESIIIPGNVNFIGRYAFQDCNNLTQMTCFSKTPPTCFDDTFANFQVSGCTLYVPAFSVSVYQSSEYWNEFTNIQPIPTTDIASGTCGDNLTWRLTEEYELVIEGVGEMYNYFTGEERAPWYEYRESIKSITMKEGITSIGDGAFLECSNVTYINIPEGVTSIGGYAISICNSVTEITIPASLIDIDATAFNLSGNIEFIDVDEENPIYKDWYNCCLVNKDTKTLVAGTTRLGGIPNEKDIEHVGDYAFCGRNIDDWGFSISQDGIVSIGYCAFVASGIKSIYLPKTLKRCEDYAFQFTAIKNDDYLSDISEVHIDDLVAWLDIEFMHPDSNPLCNGASLHLKSMLLESIVIPEGITTIKRCAFAGWNGKEVVLPESVTSIGYSAFYNCSSLTSITCHAVTPSTIYDDTFFGVDKSIPVYVPAESVEAYKSSEYWSEFTNIQPIVSELPSVVYLKNVGSGKFLTAANWWGTCASLGEHGLDMTLAQLPNGKYTIDTQIKGSESNYFLGKIGEKLYMDATSTEWMIEDLGNGCYTLSLDGTYYMGFDGTSVVSENLTNSADANAQWQLLTREDLITEMKYATMASPVDATFYIRGANFSRQDLRNSAWIGEPSIGGEDENFCAEKWNSGVCTVYQELKDLPNGVYKLKTQGFYRMGGHDVAVNHRNEGTENYDVKFFANDASVPVMSVMDEAGKLSDVGVAYGNYGNAPSDRAHATQFFNKGYYQHEFYFTVTDGTAVVGIVNNSGLLDDWMCFDNFELYYCGEAAVILDSQTSYSQVEDKQYASITYTRNFKNANWQALYVPFEIPLTEEFLDDFEIAYINDVHQFDDDNNGDIDRTEVEAIKKVSGTLEANYPYLIRAKVAGEKQIVVTDAMLYAAEENSIDCSSVFNSYTFTGTYKKIPAVQLPKEEGYYAMSGGDWKQYSSGATSSLGAFRIYMKIDSRNENMKAQAHTIKMRVVGCDDEADDVTGIDDSQLTMDNSPLVIYDMQGRRITDMANLKGVYIVNGKKVVY